MRIIRVVQIFTFLLVSVLLLGNIRTSQAAVDCEIDLRGTCVQTSNCTATNNLGFTGDCQGPTFTCCNTTPPSTSPNCEPDNGTCRVLECEEGENSIPKLCPHSGEYCCSSNSDDASSVPNIYNGPKLQLEDLIGLIYKVAFPLAIAFGIFFIIKAGYTIKMSEGNPQKKQQGFEEFASAIVGTAFVGLSLTLLRIIINQILGG